MQNKLIKGKQQQGMASFKAKAKEDKAQQGVGHWLLPRPTLDAPSCASNKSGNFPARIDAQIDSKWKPTS